MPLWPAQQQRIVQAKDGADAFAMAGYWYNTLITGQTTAGATAECPSPAKMASFPTVSRWPVDPWGNQPLSFHSLRRSLPAIDRGQEC